VAVGLHYDIPAADSLRALTELEPLPGRMRPLIGANGALLIDDTYKADTASTFSALDWLQTVVRRDGGRAIVVLGDMDVAGSAGQRGHRRAGQRASEFADALITLGAEASLGARAALDQGMEPRAVRTTYSTHDAVQSVLSLELKSNDLVLLKGGAASRLDLVTGALLNDPADAVQLTYTQEMAALALTTRPNRPAWVEIDRDSLAHNVRRLKQFVGDAVTLFAVVKADAYGHGAVGVARTALQNGAEYLAVANIHEAIDLRDAGITAPILMMSYLPPEMARQAVQYDLTATVYDLEMARLYDAAARDQSAKLRVHVKVDTGMGRLGIMADKAISLFRNLVKLTHLEVEGVYTHFSTADDFDGAYVAEQGRRFRDILVPLRASGFQVRYIHACNSAGTLRGADWHFNAVRCGIAMYGLHPSAEVPVPADFRPVLTWKTVVAQVKTLPPRHPVGYGNTYVTTGEERVAVLPLGFADGFRRAPGHAGRVLIHGQYAPIRGRVSMEKTVVSVQAIPDVNIGDEVVIVGEQGSNRITAEDLADAWGTSNYEVVTAALARIPRR
jgi:Alr-MurF fusion protein